MTPKKPIPNSEVEVEVALLQRDVKNFYTITEKLEEAVKELSKVVSKLDNMVKLQELRVEEQNKYFEEQKNVYFDTVNKISTKLDFHINSEQASHLQIYDKCMKEFDNPITSLKKRISMIEKFGYIIIGVSLAFGFAGGFGQKIISLF